MLTSSVMHGIDLHTYIVWSVSSVCYLQSVDSHTADARQELEPGCAGLQSLVWGRSPRHVLSY